MSPTVAAKPCDQCGGVMTTANVVAPYAMVVQGNRRAMVPAVNVVAVSACPTCDRARCPNAGCGMPTGPLLSLGGREIVPTTCEHCKLPIQYGTHRP